MELIDIDKLIPNKRNARIHSASQIEKIQASLREFGFVNPVLIDSDYGIIAGHGRVEAAKREGIEKVPCVWVEHLTEEQKRAYILADNRLTELGEWNTDLLATELKDLSEIGFDIDLMGFNAEDFEGAFDDVEAFEDEFEPELPKEPKTRLGEIYQLGRHRLMCGDSTDDQSVKKLMGG
jgi:ParB-like chromosome segregation protein Spo0J